MISSTFSTQLRYAVFGGGAILCCLTMGGCQAFGYREVMPYEREALASPLMSLSRDPLSDRYMEHVLETREGARGATGVSGGGCGCN